MNKTVLVPTDFSIASLNALKSMLSNNTDCQYNIILIHGCYLNEGITDLLFYSRKKALDNLCTKEFNEACDIIKNKFGNQILNIRKELFSGYNKAAFKNFVDANNIDEVCMLSNYKYDFSKKKSFDIIAYIKKSNLNISEIPYTESVVLSAKDSIAELLLQPVVAAEAMAH